jgi:hypothetical protein
MTGERHHVLLAQFGIAKLGHAAMAAGGERQRWRDRGYPTAFSSTWPDSGELDPARNVALKNFAEIVDQPELGFASSFDSLKGKLVWLKTELRQAGDVIWTEIIDIAKPHALWSAALAAPIRLDFPTRAAAAKLRHRLYRLRDVMRASQHEFSPGFLTSGHCIDNKIALHTRCERVW